jgi:hypothetical protein
MKRKRIPTVNGQREYGIVNYCLERSELTPLT